MGPLHKTGFNLYYYFLPIPLFNITKKIPPYTFDCHPIRLLCNVKKSLAILLFGPLLSYPFIKFQEKFQAILLFRPILIFGTLEYQMHLSYHTMRCDLSLQLAGTVS